MSEPDARTFSHDRLMEQLRASVAEVVRTVEALGERGDLTDRDLAMLREEVRRLQEVVAGATNPHSHERRITRTEVRLDEDAERDRTVWERIIGALSGALGVALGGSVARLAVIGLTVLLGLLIWRGELDDLAAAIASAFRPVQHVETQHVDQQRVEIAPRPADGNPPPDTSGL